MAAGDSTLSLTQTRAQFTAASSKLVGEAFNGILELSATNSNILAQLQGGEGSGKPFTIKRDLKGGRMDKVNYSVGTTLGQAGRRGTQRAVNYEEGLLQSTWPVQIDNLRVVVAWNELIRTVALTGKSWKEVYPELCGDRVGQIEQEDMLMRLRQRSSRLNTVRPGTRDSLNELRYDDTVDTESLGRAYALLTTNGAKPANIGKMTGGMPLNKYVVLGGNLALEGLWQDPTFTGALQHAHLDSPENPFWTGDIPDWRGSLIKKWDLINHDNPGPIGSSIMPQAVLGDSSDVESGGNVVVAGTSTTTIYGGGRTRTQLGDAATLYKPFEYFYGCDKLFGESLSIGTSDTGPYYFVIIDPADGKWCLYSYRGATDIASNGYSITSYKRLGASTSGSAYTTIKDDGFGGSGTVLWTYDTDYNKEDFPTGSIIVQVNLRIAPVCDNYLFGAECGGKAYGEHMNERISNSDDYGALQGVGIWSIYGSDIKQDVLGQYHRGFVRLQSTYQHPLGSKLPQIS